MSETRTSTKTDSAKGLGNLKVQQLLKAMVDQGASDLHIVAGSPPAVRISGEMHRVKVGQLSPEDSKKLIYQILTDAQIAEFEKNLELDFSFGVRGLARFRGNVFYSKGAVSLRSKTSLICIKYNPNESLSCIKLDFFNSCDLLSSFKAGILSIT